MKIVKRIGLVLLTLILIAMSASYFIVFKSNGAGSDDGYFYIKTTDSYDTMRKNLIREVHIRNVMSFDLLADYLELKSKYKPGKYKIKKNASNLDMVRMIRNGSYEQVVIKLKADMSRDSLICYLSANLEVGEEELKNKLVSDWPENEGFTKENVYCIFLPDHYFFNWASGAEEVLERFYTEYRRFWNRQRVETAWGMDMSPEQACILATIVDAEAVHESEMSKIAGLYLNRINKDIPLQADPTVLYVVGKEGRRRVLRRDLDILDEYNTYRVKGLPPGPIMLPDKRAIEAVLQAEEHNFIYMCAKEDGSFYHYFTSSYREHQRNAEKYRRAMNRLGIMR